MGPSFVTLRLVFVCGRVGKPGGFWQRVSKSSNLHKQVESTPNVLCWRCSRRVCLPFTAVGSCCKCSESIFSQSMHQSYSPLRFSRIASLSTHIDVPTAVCPTFRAAESLLGYFSCVACIQIRCACLTSHKCVSSAEIGGSLHVLVRHKK